MIQSVQDKSKVSAWRLVRMLTLVQWPHSSLVGRKNLFLVRGSISRPKLTFPKVLIKLGGIYG
jgi:hypothetical protein